MPQDGTIRVWDLETGKARRIVWDPNRRDQQAGRSRDHSRLFNDWDTQLVWSLAVAPDGSWLASGRSGGLAPENVQFWNPMSGRLLDTIITGTSGLRTMGVDPGGAWLAVSSRQNWGGENVVLILDTKSRKVLHTLAGHAAEVTMIAVAADGEWLASASGAITSDSEVRIWNPRTGELIDTLVGHAGQVNALAVAPDNSWLASAGGSVIDDCSVRIWSVGAEADGRRTSSTSDVRALELVSARSWLASVGGLRDDTAVEIWDVDTGEHLRTLDRNGLADTLAAPHDGSWLAVAGFGSGDTHIWDPATGRKLRTLHGHDGPIAALTVSPDASWLAAGGQVIDHQTRIWQPDSGELLWIPARGLPGGCQGHGICAGRILACRRGWRMENGGVRIWEIETRRRPHTLPDATDAVQSLAATAGGTRLVSAGSDGLVMKGRLQPCSTEGRSPAEKPCLRQGPNIGSRRARPLLPSRRGSLPFATQRSATDRVIWTRTVLAKPATAVGAARCQRPRPPPTTRSPRTSGTTSPGRPSPPGRLG